MGFMDIFKKKDVVSNSVETILAVDVASTNQPTNKVNLLKEREQKVTISLKKKTGLDIKARVNLMIDVSGSMSSMFSNGKVQEVLERIFPIALKLDDNGELDVWTFNNYSKYVNTPVTLDNFSTYVDKYINNIGGGTSYSPVMEDVFDQCGNDHSMPCFNIMLTDGDNSDHIKTENFIKEVSNRAHFWQFVGVGYESFHFLKKLDTMKGRVIDNANFFSVNDISKMSDEDLYDSILSEFPSWINEAKQKGILANII